jgi:hypothetical protein
VWCVVCGVWCVVCGWLVVRACVWVCVCSVPWAFEACCLSVFRLPTFMRTSAHTCVSINVFARVRGWVCVVLVRVRVWLRVCAVSCGQPGVHFYTANFLASEPPHAAHYAFCLGTCQPACEVAAPSTPSPRAPSEHLCALLDKLHIGRGRGTVRVLGVPVPSFAAHRVALHLALRCARPGGCVVTSASIRPPPARARILNGRQKRATTRTRPTSPLSPPLCCDRGRRTSRSPPTPSPWWSRAAAGAP